MPDTIEDARRLIELALLATTFRPSELHKFFEISGTVTEQPEQVWDKLDNLRHEVSGRLSMLQPEHDYARCISITQFWGYCLPKSAQSEFENAEDYADYLAGLPEPDLTAFSDLAGPEDDEIIPAANSWIIPYGQVAELDSVQLRTKLQLRDHRTGPLLLLVLPRDKLRKFGCRVRRPVGLDAVHKRHLQWAPEAVPEERIDGPLLRGTVGGVSWKP